MIVTYKSSIYQISQVMSYVSGTSSANKPKHTNLIFGLLILLSLTIHPVSGSSSDERLFIPNQGQWEGNFTHKVRFGNLTVFTREDGFRYSLNESVKWEYTDETGLEGPEVINGHAFSLQFINSNPITYSGINEQSVYYNYFLGNDESKWQSRVPLFKFLESSDLYDGINLSIGSDDGGFKYDYIVAPGADPGLINFKYTGADGTVFSAEKLVIQTSVGELIESIPVSYQIINGQRVEVKCEYFRTAEGYGFSFPDGYVSEVPLIIDPVLVASTLVGSGGGADFPYMAAQGSAYDLEGNIYAAGLTMDTEFPITEGAFQDSIAGIMDVVVVKFNDDGSDLIYATYLGGIQIDHAASIIVDLSTNELYIYGKTQSIDFPTSPNAFQSSIEGGWDLYVTRLSDDGSQILGSTYIGGNEDEVHPSGWNRRIGEIYLMPSCEVVITGITKSNDYPVTTGAFQEEFNGGQSDGVITKFSANLDEVIWSSYLGGNEMDICTGITAKKDNSIVVCGYTRSTEGFPISESAYQSELPMYNDINADCGFITHISEDGSSVIASTYLGKPGYFDWLWFVDLDSDENVWVYMRTFNSAYEATEGAWGTVTSRSMVHKLNEDLSELLVTSGVSNVDAVIEAHPYAFMVDNCDYIYISTVRDPNVDVFITTDDALYEFGPFYLAVFTPDMADLEYGTYFVGGNMAGGMSRFSEEGVLYQATHMSMYTGAYFTTENAWHETLGPNSDMAVFKIDFERQLVNAYASTDCQSVGCVPHQVSFSNYSSVQSYLWDFGDGNTSEEYAPEHTYTDPGEYIASLVVFDPESCNQRDTICFPITVYPGVNIEPAFEYSFDCDLGEIVLTNTSQVDGEVEYQWDMGDGMIISGIDSTFNYQYDEDGIYTVVLSLSNSFCGTTSIEQEVIFVPNIQAAFEFTNLSECDDYSVEFTNLSEGGAAFLWDMGDGNFVEGGNDFIYEFEEPGVYTVELTITNEESCNQSSSFFQTFEIEEPTQLNPEISVSQTGVCSDLMITATVSSVGASDEIVWSLNDEIVAENDVTLETSVSQAGIYSLVVEVSELNCGIVFTDEVEIELIDSLGFELPPSLSFCYYDEFISLNATVPFEDAIYDWNNGLSNEPLLEITSEGSYTVDVSHNGCVETQSTSVNAIQSFPLFFEDIICDGQETVILFQDPFEIIEDVNWANGQNGFGIVVDQVGYYPFTAIDIWGCQQIDSLQVIARDADANLEIPNVFTPNGDGRNDVFQIQGDSLEYYQLQIYDRWGRKVFESDEMYGAWNGIFEATSGKEANDDTFMYVLNYKGACDQSIRSKTGHLKVLR